MSFQLWKNQVATPSSCSKSTEENKEEIKEETASQAVAKETSTECCSSGSFVRTGWCFHIQKKYFRQRSEGFPLLKRYFFFIANWLWQLLSQQYLPLTNAFYELQWMCNVMYNVIEHCTSHSTYIVL